MVAPTGPRQIARHHPTSGDASDGVDRAQLILVGSIAIAVVLVGITLVLNSAVLTENVAGGSSVEVTGDVAEFDREAVRSVRSLTIRVNHAKAYDPSGTNDLHDDIRANISTYSRLLAESYADTGSVFVNVSFAEVNEMGTRFVQQENSQFEGGSPPSPPPTWVTVDDPYKLGWLVVNFDVENVSRTERFYISVENATEELNVSVRRDSTNHLLVNSSIGGDHVSNATCKPENGRVLLDVKSGDAYSASCTFNSTDYLEPPYEHLEFVNGDAATGKYDIVVNGTPTTPGVGNACNAAAPIDFPCKADAVWSLNFTTTYRTSSIAYEHDHNVTVYDP